MAKTTKTVKVTLVRSPIGFNRTQGETVKGMGLRRIRHTVTLLDTPGPNESGQPHLRKMLKDQLAKASAVLAVLDFTQLKSDADAVFLGEI